MSAPNGSSIGRIEGMGYAGLVPPTLMELCRYLGYVGVVGEEIGEFDGGNPLTISTNFLLVVCQTRGFTKKCPLLISVCSSQLGVPG